MKHLPTLPDDIWNHICGFLTNDQVRELYSVNRPMFLISMKLRYRCIEIGKLDGTSSQTERTYEVSKRPNLVKFIHSLKLVPNQLRYTTSFFGGLKDSETEHSDSRVPDIGEQNKRTWDTLKKLVIERVRTKAPPIAAKLRRPRSMIPYLGDHKDEIARKQIMDDLETFVGSLSHLTELEVNWPDQSGSTPLGTNWSISFLEPGWKAFGSNLRELTLSGSITTWELILSHELHLERLESLAVNVEMGFTNPNNDTYAIRLALAPFIRRHSATLQSLSFASRMVVDLTALYDGIGRLSQLRKLEIVQPCSKPTDNHSDGLNQFLFRNVDTITSFSWSFLPPTPSSLSGPSYTQGWYEQPPYHLTLPRLQTLHLRFPPSIPFDGALYYCARHAQTLTSLSLDGITLTLAQLAELILLVGSPETRELNISLDTLTSSVFINLANKFPNLRVLRLAYDQVGRQKSNTEPILVDPTGGGRLKIPNPVVIKQWHFKKDMDSDGVKRVLGSWGVENLYLKKVGHMDWKEYKGEKEQIGRCIVKCLKKVGFVNGSYREAFLKAD